MVAAKAALAAVVNTGGTPAEAAAAEGTASATPAAPSSPAARYAAQAKKREGNPFASRIAAHAGCTKKLWRARYLALREVRHAFVVLLFSSLLMVPWFRVLSPVR